MSDVVFIAVLLAFFVLCASYVQLCDRMIGPDDPGLADPATDSVADSDADFVADSFTDGGSDLEVPATAGTRTGATS